MAIRNNSTQQPNLILNLMTSSIAGINPLSAGSYVGMSLKVNISSPSFWGVLPRLLAPLVVVATLRRICSLLELFKSFTDGIGSFGIVPNNSDPEMAKLFFFFRKISHLTF